jgi:hypothetical protein
VTYNFDTFINKFIYQEEKMKKMYICRIFFICFLLCVIFLQSLYAQMFSGRVYEGTKGVEPPTSTPLANVKMKLYGSNNQEPLGVILDSTITDSNGWYSLRIISGYEYYNIKEFDPSGYISDGATSVTGTVVNANRIRFVVPLDDDTLTGNKFWDKKRVQQNNAPIADADGPYSGKVGNPVTFDGSGSYDPDPGDSISKYEWDFDNDGQYDDGTGKYASHTFNSTGTGLVRLKVTDTHGAYDTDSTIYTITESSKGEIRGTKFNDQNSSGIRDPGEPGMSGWFIWAEQDGNGKLDQGEENNTTDSNGKYQLAGLSSGTYYVYESMKSGWTKTYPSGQYHTITVGEGQIVEDVDFGNYKRQEQQNDYDYGDAPDSYKTVKASTGAKHTLGGPYLGHIQPDPELDGQPGLLADNDDITGIHDEDGASFPMDLVVGKKSYFSFFIKDPGKSSTIGFWLDMNMDGDFDDSEDLSYHFAQVGANMVHVTVYFKIPKSTPIGTSYARFRVFQGLTSSVLSYGDGGKGEVEDYIITFKTEGDSLPSGGIIVGSKWHDLNGDGIWDNNETALPNWTIWLDANQNGVKDPEIPGGDKYTLTNSKGNFIFSGLNHGNYIIGEENPPGWSQTYPGGDGTFTVAVKDTMINRGYIFGNRQAETESEYDWGDAPDPMYPTLAASNGANHKIDSTIFLGFSVDPESNGQPNMTADQDDYDGNDDEDGIVFNTPLVLGQTVQVTATASTSGYLNAWADFNINGTWMDTGEQIFTDESLVAGANVISFSIPSGAYTGDTFIRFRFSSQQGLSFDGQAQDGEVEDYYVEIIEEGGEGEGEGAVKWSQPPLFYSFEDPCFYGWDEIAFIPELLIADDWFCDNPRPVTWIRWWGSYTHWDSIIPPPYPHVPVEFHIGIWTDVPTGEDRDFSHPGTLIHRWYVNNDQWQEHPAGCDYMPERSDKPETCYEYLYMIPKDQWFYQEADSAIFWLSISAIYDSIPADTLWGWKTREHYFNDDAVRIHQPFDLVPGGFFQAGEPVKQSWDMAFELGTDIYIRDFDFGDAPEIGYGTFLERNGAHHLVKSKIRLGDNIDVDPDGQPHPDAKGDDDDSNDDEDGIKFMSDLVPGDRAQVLVSVSAHGFLNAWLDFHRNGHWLESEDQIFYNFELPPGTHDLDFKILDDAEVGETFARFRFSSLPHVQYNGMAIDGEVEDYMVQIQPSTGVLNNDIERKPVKFMLHQNCPNPFNPVTKIKYEIPKPVHVHFVLYDIMGREIVTLVDKVQEPGFYTVTWHGKDNADRPVSSGLYIYYLQAGSFNRTGKLLLMK